MGKKRKESAALYSDIRTFPHLNTLFQNQKLLALATQEPGNPYLSLMAFAMTEDLRSLIVATQKGTRKYNNMVNSPGVSFLIDNRSSERDLFRQTMAVTGLGRAMEIEERDKEALMTLYLKKNPELEAFVRSPECALFKLVIDDLVVIDHFREAEEKGRP
jgi:nitroimidazol reductase NimA-like FMN-containing flavoprotein (pyridoxamine 5'-phosphate oxidase superfamily)